MLKKTNVLVTGASGFIGSQVCKTLAEKGLAVYGLYRHANNRLNSLSSINSFNPLCLDINDFEKLNKYVAKIKPDAIFHVAALHSPIPLDKPHPFFNANVLGTLNVLETCRLNNVTKFIHSSSMSVYGRKAKYLPVDEKHPVNPYDFYSQTKKMSEDLCTFYANNFELRLVILRYVGVFGPGRTWGAMKNFAENAMYNKNITINSNINWDILYVNDVAEANYQSYLKINKIKNQIINIGMGKETNIIDLAKKIIKITESKSKIEVKFPKNSHPHRFYFNIRRAKRLIELRPTELNKALTNCINCMKYDNNNPSA